MQEVNITIDKDAAITVTVNGVKGKTCKDVTAQVEAALGTAVASKATAEMYEAPMEQHRTQGR